MPRLKYVCLLGDGHYDFHGHQGFGTPNLVPPFLVETEFSVVRFHGSEGKARAVYRGMTPLSADDVAEVVVFAATRPPHVELAEALLLPTDQASSTLVHREE